MSLADTAIADLDYIEVLIAVVIAFILYSAWLRVVENLAYTSFRLNPKSTFHAFVVAFCVTIIFFTLIRSVNSISRGIIIGDTQASSTSVGTFSLPIVEEPKPPRVNRSR